MEIPKLPDTLRTEDEIIATWKGDISKPLVSVRCITYNHAPYIEDAIKGFLIQETDFPIEVWIHDDASTDGTREIVESYQKRYPRIIKTILQDENQYSKGIKPSQILAKKCVGDFIALCEGDDYWVSENKLQWQVGFISKNPSVSMCFHNAIVIHEGEDDLNIPFGEIENREYSGEEILEKWTIPTASVLFRRACYHPIVNSNFLHGDIVFFLSMADKGKILATSDFMSVYRKHPGGVTSHLYRGIPKLQRKIIHYKEIRKSFDGKYKDVVSRLLPSCYLSLAFKQLKNFDSKFVLNIYLSFRENPKVSLEIIKDILLGRRHIS